MSKTRRLYLTQWTDDASGAFLYTVDKADPLAVFDLNRNLLAWFAFEETARLLAERCGVEC